MLTQLHPYVVHFPVALLLISVVLFFLGKAGGSRTWASAVLSAARWNLWLGSAFALASIASGFVDYQAAQCDAATIADTIIHRRSGAVTWWSSLIAGIAVYRTRHRAPGPLLLAWLLLTSSGGTSSRGLLTGSGGASS